MARCPHCEAELEGLGTFCWTCERCVGRPCGECRACVASAGATSSRQTVASPYPSTPAGEDPRLEDEIEAAIDKAMGKLGYRVIRFSQKRASRQTPGWPDRMYAAPWAWTLAEIKKADGIVSEEQRELHAFFRLCGIPVVVWYHERDAKAWHREVTAVEAP